MNERPSNGPGGRWDVVLRPSAAWNWPSVQEIWRHRDLLLLFVRRDLLAVYQQTVLGPLWQVLQPLLLALVFAAVFGGMAGLSPQGVPALLFYLAGVVPWTFFSNLVSRTSNSLVWNAALITKVWFPRLVAPLATTLSTGITFLVQLSVHVLFAVGYLLAGQWSMGTGTGLAALPFLAVLLAAQGLGIGLIVAALTAKYRDLSFLVAFGLQLLLYASPVVFPMARLQDGTALHTVIALNPLSAVIEAFRAALLGFPVGWAGLAYSAAFAAGALATGTLLFHRVERSFADVA